MRLVSHLVALRFFIVFSSSFLSDLGSILLPNLAPGLVGFDSSTVCFIARVFHYPCVFHYGATCSPWFYWGPSGCARTMELASAVVLNNGGGQRHCSAPLFRTTALNNGAGHPPLFWRSLGGPVKYLFKPKAAWGPVVENTRVMKHTGDETHALVIKRTPKRNGAI